VSAKGAGIYCFTAIVAHVVLLLLMSLYFHPAAVNLALGESHAIYSYVLAAADSSAKKTVTKEIQKHLTEAPKQVVQQKSSAQPSHKTFAQHRATEGNGKPITDLIAKLHAAIQSQQRYPEVAMQMERSGNTIVSFLLFPNGTISQLKIVKKSGTESLDEAALAAVNDAVPFKEVDSYLNRPQEYQITIVFELT
jgi:periplasmic protein TonB